MSLPSRAEFLRKFGDGTVVVISCRRPGSGPRMPGARRFICLLCLIDIEASPAGQEHIAQGGVPLCNACAITLAEAAKEQGRLGAIASTPEADASISSGRAIDAHRIDRLRAAHPWEKP